MRSRYYESNTEEERVLIFQDHFDRDLESFFCSQIACCDKCHEDFRKFWPGTVSRDIELQRGYMTIDDFLQNSRIQDSFYPEEIEHFSKFLTCPNCDMVLNGEFWIYEHPFDVPRDFSNTLNEIARLASHSPFLLLTHSFAREVLDTIVEFGSRACAEPIKHSLFRARRADSLPSPVFSDFGAAPAHIVAEGRYNHSGDPMIYLANTEKTAFAEIATPGVRFHVAELSLNVSLKTLDLSLMPEAETPGEDLIQCLAGSSLCSAPRTGEGWVRQEYVFTRFVADCARHAGFQAIKYGSTKDPAGSNLVLLYPPTDIATIASLAGVRTLP